MAKRRSKKRRGLRGTPAEHEATFEQKMRLAKHFLADSDKALSPSGACRGVAAARMFMEHAVAENTWLAQPAGATLSLFERRLRAAEKRHGCDCDPTPRRRKRSR